MSRAACPDRDRIARFVRGDLSGAEADEVRAHLHSCVSCTNLFTRLEAARDQVPDLDDPVSTVATGVSRPFHQAQEPTMVGDGTPGIRPSPILFLDPPHRQDELGRLAHFRVLKKLGAGGMGMVFEAEDTALERPVALKVMLPEMEEVEDSAARFLREARLCASIKSDHIVTIYHVGEVRGIPFLAMELLRGETLEDWLKRHPEPSVKEVLRIGRELAVGLIAAHERGLVHRDIKPANIWMESPRGRVKILDFGLARPAHGGEQLTSSGVIIGTPAYMAPEQARGKTVDARSDLFSLGSVIYEMATGRRAFGGTDPMAVLSSLALDNPPPPIELNLKLPKALSDSIMRLLAKDPDDRPATARKVAEEMTRIRKELDGGSSTTMPGTRTAPLPRVEPLPQPKPRRSAPSNPWIGIDDDEVSELIRPAPLPAAKSKPPLPVEKNRARRPLWIALAAFGLIATAAFLMTMTMSVKTEKGTLFIQTDDPDVEVTLQQNGATILQRTTKREIELKVGDYEIELAEKKEELKLSTRAFSITRNGKQTVTVKFDKATDVPKEKEKSVGEFKKKWDK